MSSDARRRRGVRAGAGAVLALAAACACREDDAGATAAAAVDLRADRRIAPLLEACPQGGFYDRDLSDLVPVLAAKLEQGRPDPLKRAKEELGELGARAFPVLGNAFHAFYADPMRSPFLENVVDALTFNTSDAAHALLIEALRHPQESVRSKSLDGLRRLARPEDFDLLVERLSIEAIELRRHTIPALFTADRHRAEALFAGALEQGAERDLWLDVAPALRTSDDPEIAARCAELIDDVEPLVAMSLAACAARGGRAEGLAYLREQLRSEEPQRRLAAVEALGDAGLLAELGPPLLEDASVDVRALAATALQSALLDDERRKLLRTALNDASEAVSSEALVGLCEQDDPEGLARALTLLDGPPAQLQQALIALRAPLGHDPRLAEDAFARLERRHALEEHRPVQQRAATFKAFGQLPLRAAAELLHRIGVAAAGEKIESLPAHDWLMIQAANTGIPGRTYLAEQLAIESDPARRLDLLDAVGAIRDELARTTLLQVAEESARSPFERLFAASLVVKTGPSWEVAPRLKRVAFAMQAREDVEARAALQCLLWQWY